MNLLTALTAAADKLDRWIENMRDDLSAYVTKDGERTKKPLPSTTSWPDQDDIDEYIEAIEAQKFLAAEIARMQPES